jgi:hypothetical protein
MDGGVVVVTVNPVNKGVAAALFQIVIVTVGVGAGIIRAPLVNLPVAVIVVAVTDLPGAGMEGGVVVVAVDTVIDRVAAAFHDKIAIAVRVDAGIGTVLGLVHFSVAVVIDTIVANLRGVGMNGRVVVITVDTV